jgi:hypothetical protein
MSSRDKKKTPAPTFRRSPTRRGITPFAPEPQDFYIQFAPVGSEPAPAIPEPASSTKPTRRDISARALAAAEQLDGRMLRGEFSVGAARGIPSNEVSGTIGAAEDTKSRTRTRRSSKSPPEPDVYLASASKREITVIVNGEALTLERRDALALAAIITTSFA